MEDGSKPVLPFGKLSVTKRDDKKDTSNKTDKQYGDTTNTLQAALSDVITLGDAVLTGREDQHQRRLLLYRAAPGQGLAEHSRCKESRRG